MMRLFLISLCFGTSHVLALRRVTQNVSKQHDIKHNETISTPAPSNKNATNKISAEVYVINLDARKDRCECAKLQFAESPYPVYRASAATPDNHLQLCTGLGDQQIGRRKTPMRPVQKANFCSFHQIWKQVSERKDKPDFVIVVEDDVQIPSAFWKELQQLLDNKCVSNELVAVDTYGPGQHGHKSKCSTQSGPQVMFNATSHERYGSHFLIAPSAILDRLALQPWVVTDHYPDYQNVSIKLWQPGLLKRGSSFRSKHLHELGKECDASVKRSDIPRHTLKAKLLGKFDSESESESESESMSTFHCADASQFKSDEEGLSVFHDMFEGAKNLLRGWFR